MPIATSASCNSNTVLPSRALAKARSSTLSRGAGSADINSFAASIRNFGFAVRAGAPRRSQASSLRIRLLRLMFSVLPCRSRSALAKTKAE